MGKVSMQLLQFCRKWKCFTI